MALFVGTDIGGTFTDIVGYDSTRGALSFGKTLSTPKDLVQGVMTCLDDIGIDPREVDILKHGTTQIINTLLERTGARTALITTKGFRDVVEIGRASRPLAFDLDYRRPPPLVPAHMRLNCPSVSVPTAPCSSRCATKTWNGWPSNWSAWMSGPWQSRC